MISTVADQYSGADKALIERAFAFAEKAHAGQLRASGEPYITHPIAVATYLAELGVDAPSIAAGLLHDSIEDCGVTRAQVEELFGSEVAFLVDGVTKLSAISARDRARRHTGTDVQTESLKKMFFAMAEDLRVILIKLSDRLHNMQTLKAKRPDDRMRVSLQTLDIYAPIAGRLGMGRLKGELEDLAFPWAYPAEWAWLKRTIKGKYEDRLRYIQRTAPLVRAHLNAASVPVVDIHARAKRMWSLYRKLKRYDMDPDKVMDLVALRIIVPDIKSCYEALGVIHTHYKPMPGRIKDYIALPKPNGYQSLHTTVFCEKGRIAEIQIRTQQMHDHAENGVAAHWSYTESGKQSVRAKNNELAWINQLKSVLKNITTSADMADVKIDFFKDRIFVLTPQGDVKDLPEGATPVDFAYTLHSELGHRVQGAIVNGRLMPLTTTLQSGDVVEIMKGKAAKPSMDWVRFVKTNHAAKHIRSWFKKNDPAMAIVDGRTLLNHELAKSGLTVERLNRTRINQLLDIMSVNSLDDLLTQLSMGDIDPAVVARHISPLPAPPKKQKVRVNKKLHMSARPMAATVTIAGSSGLAYRMGRCCSPAGGVAIAGYLTLNRGVTIHRADCANITTAPPQRLMEAGWSK